MVVQKMKNQSNMNFSKYLMIMAITSLMAFTVGTYPSLIAAFLLLAPAIIMNVLWVLAHTASNLGTI